MITPLITPHLLSHGTVECEDMAATRRFFEEFLGVEVVRPLPEAHYLWKGGPWTVVCVHVDGEPKDQGRENRFALSVASAGDVAAAHEAAERLRETYGIRQIDPIKQNSTGSSFLLQDLNMCWWEISEEKEADYDAIFSKGDIAA